MSAAVCLDAGPLGMVTNPRLSGDSLACFQWLQTLIARERRIIVPEIADYEVRRELLRGNKINGLRRLDTLQSILEYMPLTTAAMRRAADFWAEARRTGKPTAGDQSLDGDMILAAQVDTSGIPDIVIATTNVGHLSRFAPADLWSRIL